MRSDFSLNIRCSVEFKLFVKDIKRYVILISILLCYAVGLPTLAMGALSISTSEWIFSAPVFYVLVQDAPALPVCRAFVATATILPEVDPLEPDIPPKSRCRTSTAVLT